MSSTTTETGSGEASATRQHRDLGTAGHTLPHTDYPAPNAQKALPAPRGNRGGLLRKLGLLLVLIAITAFVVYRIRDGKATAAAEADRTAAAASRPIPVTVTPVVSRTMPIFYTALGTVTPYYAVTIKSRVDGQLLSVNVTEGQHVRKGQVLGQIDPRPYQAVVAQAEGQLAKDQASANNTSSEAGRYKALYEAGIVSKESAQAQIANAGQSVGSLAADRASIQAARVNVGYAHITSPIDGVVGLRQVDPGNIVHASDAQGLMLITQLQPIAVIFTLPEDQLPNVMKRMHAGQKLTVEAYDRNQTQHLATGTLLTIDNQIDPSTGTVKAKAVFSNQDGALFPNQFVNCRLILEQRPNSILIPAAALQTGSQGTFVYVVRQGNPPKQADGAGGGGKGRAGKPSEPASGSGAAAGAGPQQPQAPPAYVVVQPVAVDLTEGSQVILSGGVQPGDEIVIDGQEKLKPFARVVPREGRPLRAGPTGGIGVSSDSTGGSAGGNTPDPLSPQPGSTRPSSDPNRAGSRKHSGGPGDFATPPATPAAPAGAKR